MGADIIVGGYAFPDGQYAAYRRIKEKKKVIFTDGHKYEIIFHGKHTKTTGLHIHIGRHTTGSGLLFFTEGHI